MDESNNNNKSVRFSTVDIDLNASLSVSNKRAEYKRGASVESNKAVNAWDEYETPKSKVADGGFRAWLVCVATMWSYGIIMGNEFNYGLIYDKFIDVYNGTPNHVTYAAWIGSLELGIESLFYLPSAICIDLFGTRKPALVGTIFQFVALLASAFIDVMPLYFITESLLLGIGQAFLTEATYTILPHYFEKRLGLASGLMNLGSSVITIGFLIATSRLLKDLGLFYSFIILAGIALTTLISSIAFVSVLEPEHKSENFCTKFKESFGFKVVKRRQFLLWGFSSFIGLFGTKIPPITINNLATDKFPETLNSEMLNIVFTATTGIGGIIFGKLLDYAKFSHIYFHAMAYFIYGVSQIALVHAPSFTILVVIYGIYGIGNGIYFTCLTPVAVQVSGSPTLGAQAIGYYFLFAVIPLIVGPIIAGNLKQNLGSYDVPYYFGAAMCFACCIIQLLYPDGFIFKALKAIFVNKFPKRFLPKRFSK